MRWLKTLASTTLLASLAVANTGCIKKILLDAQIAATRKASQAVSTISDFEVVKAAQTNALSRGEGLHFLAPDNADALFMLTKGWSSYGVAFVEDEMEQAEDDHGVDSELVAHHRARAAAAYSRAVHYGLIGLTKEHGGFDEAKKNEETLKAWLDDFDEDDVPFLFWTGQAWMSRVNMLKEDTDMIAELFVGAAMVKRALELDETYANGVGHVAIASYHARAKMAELDDSKKHFERAIELTGGKALLPKATFAIKYYCLVSDKANYTKLLTEVLEAGDTMPTQRIQNTIAKRKARRYMAPKRMARCGF